MYLHQLHHERWEVFSVDVKPQLPPVSGWFSKDADVATAPTAVATQLAPTASEPTMLEYAQVGLLQRQ